MAQFGWGPSELPPKDQQDSAPTLANDKDNADNQTTRTERKPPTPSEPRVDHQKSTSQFSQSDQSNLLIDPALRDDTPLSSLLDSDKKQNESVKAEETNSRSTSISMSHRAEPVFMSSSHRRHHFDDSHRLPSPPPSIATIPHSHSPSPSVASVDRSSISTPPIRRSPPQASMHPPPLFSSSYHHDPSMIQSSRHHSETHFSARAEPMNHGGYIYSTHPPFDQRYDHSHNVNHSPYHAASGLPTHFAVPTMAHPQSYGHPYPQPGQTPVAIIHTDDAATKLSDRVRRRCFNCCTTDTSTWRRSNLSPGKVLCNKCGLFERTHSRPRPEQFPHKRGPLATTSLQRRTPPANHFPPTHLPPIAPPYHYTHPSIAPLSNNQEHRRDAPSSNTLPGLQTWHNGNGGDSASGSPHMAALPTARRPVDTNSHPARPPTPPPSLSRSVNSSQDSSSRDPAPSSSSSREATV